MTSISGALNHGISYIFNPALLGVVFVIIIIAFGWIIYKRYKAERELKKDPETGKVDTRRLSLAEWEKRYKETNSPDKKIMTKAEFIQYKLQQDKGKGGGGATGSRLYDVFQKAGERVQGKSPFGGGGFSIGGNDEEEKK